MYNFHNLFSLKNGKTHRENGELTSFNYYEKLIRMIFLLHLFKFLGASISKVIGDQSFFIQHIVRSSGSVLSVHTRKRKS